MDEAEAEERYRRLVGAVTRARRLLFATGDEQWASWLGAVARELAAHDAHGLTRLLGAFGGMGSFTDVVVHPRNGHRVDDADVGRVNEELDRLRASMYADAVALRRAR